MKSKFRWPRCSFFSSPFIPLMTTTMTQFLTHSPSSCFSHPNSDSLVKVRAQVMTRDESTEGWLPLQGGGLANVSIRKRARMPDVGGHEYIIYGQRISDQTVIALIEPWISELIAVSAILGDSQLRYQPRSSVLQSHAHVPSLEGWKAAERSHISNGSWRESFRQGNHQSIRRSYRR